MTRFLYSVVFFSAQSILISSLRILQRPPLNCTQAGLVCTATATNCIDAGWLKHRRFTPSSPTQLTVEPVVKTDENGDQVPVIWVKWRPQTDGSILFLNGSEVNILQLNTNYNLCVRYTFLNKITSMTNPSDKLWSFSLDSVVVDPDQVYMVSVYNLPKPNNGHDSYHLIKEITIPGCKDPRMQHTKVCLESGSLWRSNISLQKSEGPGRKGALNVGFNGGNFSEKYKVSVLCTDSKSSLQSNYVLGNRTRMNVTFALENWPRTCCNFTAEVQPFFIQCRNDCIRHKKNFKICPSPDFDSPRDPKVWLAFVGLGVFLFCGVVSCTYLWRRKRKRDCLQLAYPPDPLIQPTEDPAAPSRSPRKVLIIYSLDHPLYKDIVLKLCAFLRAKCGTEVVLDLLDQAWLGTVGRMQWLDWQKQQIEKSSDKILILCSRGVQAKWRAMCGESRVMLREDVRSPMGDMLTPAFSLIIPDLLHPVAFGRYVVAYFEDVSVEEDVPSPFNVTIKYKLMKHFEELYFRILDKEKHEPGRLNHINGISQDEYFSCPSGKALRDAIEAFQAYQLEHPDWFEKECVDSEEEALHTDLQRPLLGDLHSNPTLQCVPECCEGPPTLVNEVEIIEDTRGVLSLTPLINHGGERVYSVHPAIDDAPRISIAEVHSTWSEDQQCPITGGNTPPLRGEDIMQSLTVENHEEESSSHLSPNILMELLALQNSLCPVVCQSSMSPEENPCENRASSESDQGYISSSSPLEDPISALSKLQKICLEASGFSLDMLGPEGGVSEDN